MAADHDLLDTGYTLRRPACEAEWQAYHEIRREVDFEGSEDDDPEENAPGNHPLVLLCADRPVGTIRIDSLHDGAAAFRLVAVSPREQGQGHGRILLREAEAFARSLGCGKAVVYATPEAAGFYDRAGYSEDPFDDTYFGGVVMMTKALHYAGYGPGDE